MFFPLEKAPVVAELPHASLAGKRPPEGAGRGKRWFATHAASVTAAEHWLTHNGLSQPRIASVERNHQKFASGERNSGL